MSTPQTVETTRKTTAEVKREYNLYMQILSYHQNIRKRYRGYDEMKLEKLTSKVRQWISVLEEQTP